jgi:hypothetical protein
MAVQKNRLGTSSPRADLGFVPLRRGYRPARDLHAASFWTAPPKRTDARLWNSATFSTPSKHKLRMNFHAFWRAETKTLGELRRLS